MFLSFQIRYEVRLGLFIKNKHAITCKNFFGNWILNLFFL